MAPAVAVLERWPSSPLTLIIDGVRAFVTPADGGGALLRAVRTVAGGGHLLESHHVEALVAELHKHRHDRFAPVRLTPRERDVLDALHEGKSLKQTASVMSVTVKTVENTQRLLFSKLGVRTRAEAVARSHSMRTGETSQ